MQRLGQGFLFGQGYRLGYVPLNPTPVFGRIFVSAILEQVTVATLKKWFPTYIRQIEYQLGILEGQIPSPVNYTTRNKFDSLPGEELPKCVVVAPGLAKPPRKDGYGAYTAEWRLGVGVATAAKTEEEVQLLTKIYGAAARAIILQELKKENQPLINDVIWIHESYDDLPIREQIKLYVASANFFEIGINDVVTRKAGPNTPDLTPESEYEYPRVEHVFIDIEKGQ